MTSSSYVFLFQSCPLATPYKVQEFSKFFDFLAVETPRPLLTSSQMLWCVSVPVHQFCLYLMLCLWPKLSHLGVEYNIPVYVPDNHLQSF